MPGKDSGAGGISIDDVEPSPDMAEPGKRLKRGFTRRQFLATSAKVAAAGAAVSAIPTLVPSTGRAFTPADPAFSSSQRETLDAALARIIPAERPGDWSAASAGAGDYIERLLSGDNVLYAGGPTREHFGEFQELPRAKEMGWEAYITHMRSTYAAGLAQLDARAGGSFVDASPEEQDLILQELDFEGSEFFALLYDHTMEGVYSHPVYGGNSGYVAWQTFGYAGDVHGVRFPDANDPGPDKPWNVFGGYSPEEIAQPGSEES